MDTCLSSVLFTASFSAEKDLTRKSYDLTDAQKVGFKEGWLQQAISENPELVLAPCRAADLISKDERWSFWGSEVPVEAGAIDVLLVSELGRVAIVETKLAYNPGARREVVAQVLDYAIHLQSRSVTDLPKIPQAHDGRPTAEDVENKLREGDYLLIVAGDQLEPRAVKLSEVFLGKHLVRPWDLVLVDVAVFQSGAESGEPKHLLVPHLRGMLVADRRQVVTVKVERENTRLTVENIAPVAIGRTPKWTEVQFFAAVAHAPSQLADFTTKIQQLCREYPELGFDFGASKEGSLLLKKNGANLLTFFLAEQGSFSFRRRNDSGEDNFAKAFGNKWGSHYRRGLEKLLNRSMESGTFFSARFEPETAESVLRLLREALNGSRADQRPSETAPAA
jgi:hypothetical protein